MWSLKSSCSGVVGRGRGAQRNSLLFCCLLAAALLFCSNVWAFDDPLETPAIKSALAAKSLLLDITKSGGRLVAVGTRGHILCSDNNGQSWQQAQVPVRETLTAVSFPDSMKAGWVVGHSSVVLKTDDGGQTWIKQVDGNMINQLMLDAANAAMAGKKAELAVAAEADRNQIEDEMANLEYLVSDAEAFLDNGPIRPFLDVCFRNDEVGIAVGQFGLIVQTRDGGKTWTTPIAAIDNPNGYHLNSVLWFDGSWFVAGEKGFFARSQDDGKSWEVIETPYEGTFFAQGADQQSLVLLGLRGNVVISSDRGESWTSVESEAKANLTSVSFLKDGRLLVSQNERNLLVSDKNRTRLMPLPWQAGTSISAFALADDGSLVTVGLGGIMHISKDEFSTEVSE